MKNVYKYIGLLVIAIFSFYYTDRLVLIVQKNSPIMKKIDEEKIKRDVKSVNAIINDDKIIPGKNGLEINDEKSFSLMKSFGTFNSYYLVFEQVKPMISLENNKDKIITSGNKINKKISFILETDENLIAYFKINRIKNDILVDKYKINKNICLYINKEIKKICKNKYLVNTELELTNDNVYDIKNKLENGSIILIKNNTSIDTINIILNQAKFKGLKIVYYLNYQKQKPLRI